MKLSKVHSKRAFLLFISLFVLLIGFQNCENNDPLVYKQSLQQTDTPNRNPANLQLQNTSSIQESNDPDDDMRSRVKAIAVGSDHTCVIMESPQINNQVKCWGRNDYGQLGLGDTNARGDGRDIPEGQDSEMGDDLLFVDLGDGHGAKAISAGDKHTCVILETDQVKCWGRNDYGQLGLGDIESRGDHHDDPDTDENENEMGDDLPYVDLGTDRTAKAIIAKYNYTCAILDNDQVKCWGDNYFGQLGLGDINSRGDDSFEMGDALPAIDLGKDQTAKAITAGKNHTCAILNNNDDLKCWGLNNFGQLGQGHKTSLGDGPNEMGDNLLAIQLGTAVKSVIAGDSYTCAILDNDGFKCWGINHLLSQNSVDYFGDDPNEMGDNLPIIQLGIGRIAQFAAAGPYHVCLILNNNNDLKCWGKNEQGQLGLGDTNYRGDQDDERIAQLPIVYLGSNRYARFVVAGENHTCAILDNDQVKCWGGNEYGQLGLDQSDHYGDHRNEMGDNLEYVNLGT